MTKVIEKIKNFFCGKLVCKPKKEEEFKLHQEKPQAKDRSEEKKQ